MQSLRLFFRPLALARTKPVVIVVTVLLASVVGLQGAAQDQGGLDQAVIQPHPRQTFGLVHLTNTQVAHLYFTNTPGLNNPRTPIRVQLEFLDSSGNSLLQAEPALVRSGETISLDLFGEGLPFPPGASLVGVRAVADILTPQARGIATLELEDDAASSRFILFAHPKDIDAIPSYRVFPTFSLKSHETAKLTVVNIGHAAINNRAIQADLWFRNASTFDTLARKDVTVDLQQSATLDLSDFNGLVFATVFFESALAELAAEVTLEIFDNSTGERVTISDGRCPRCGFGGALVVEVGPRRRLLRALKESSWSRW